MAPRPAAFVLAALLAAWLSPSPGRVAAEGIAPQPAKGKFLVAARSLRDPNFDQTVVLLLDYSPEGALGLVVNRPMEMKLSLLLPDAEGIGDRADVVYEGGPVLPGAMVVLLRADEELDETREILEGVLATPSREILEQRLAQGLPADRLRVYFGHAGWGPGQLDAEIARHDWLILSGDADTVFDATPSEVWPRLIRRESDLVASLDDAWTILTPTAPLGETPQPWGRLCAPRAPHPRVTGSRVETDGRARVSQPPEAALHAASGGRGNELCSRRYSTRYTTGS